MLHKCTGRAPLFQEKPFAAVLHAFTVGKVPLPWRDPARGIATTRLETCMEEQTHTIYRGEEENITLGRQQYRGKPGLSFLPLECQRPKVYRTCQVQDRQTFPFLPVPQQHMRQPAHTVLPPSSVCGQQSLPVGSRWRQRDVPVTETHPSY